jgi:hypothetical protein
MSVHLDEVVPFGRSLDEYIRMFNLTPCDRNQPILGIADGPASFNAEGTRLGYQITSVDPLYVFTADQIQQQFEAVVDNIITQIKNTPEDWIWTYHRSPDDLRKNRETALHRFCEDYEKGKTEHRYLVGSLPDLNHLEKTYALGLCSHFLFLYSEQLSEAFHLESIHELLRICEEVRIFPLLTLKLERSPYLEPVIQALECQGYTCEIQTVTYELQKGGNQMLRIQKQHKSVQTS